MTLINQYTDTMASFLHSLFPIHSDKHAHEDDAVHKQEERRPPSPFDDLSASVFGSPFLITSDLPPTDADTAYAPNGSTGDMKVDNDVAARTDMEAVDDAFASATHSPKDQEDAQTRDMLQQILDTQARMLEELQDAMRKSE